MVCFSKVYVFSVVLKRKEWRMSDFTYLKIDFGSSLTTNSVGFVKSSDFYNLSFIAKNSRFNFNCGYYLPLGKKGSDVA